MEGVKQQQQNEINSHIRTNSLSFILLVICLRSWQYISSLSFGYSRPFLIIIFACTIGFIHSEPVDDDDDDESSFPIVEEVVEVEVEVEVVVEEEVVVVVVDVVVVEVEEGR